MTQAERSELMDIIRQLSYEEREVTLASGRKSNFYFDGKQTCLHAKGGLLVGKAFWKEIKQLPGRRRPRRCRRPRLHHPQGAERPWHRAMARRAEKPSEGESCRHCRGCDHDRRVVDESGGTGS